MIVIQARKESTRLPNKMFKEFNNGNRLIDEVVKACQHTGIDVVIACPDNEDWELEFTHCKVFQGHPTDLVERFIQVGEYYGLKDMIRVCGDSPFIFPELIQELNDMPSQDYIGYEIRGIPAIQTGVGIYPEKMSLKALKELNRVLPDKHPSREHCTQGLYSLPQFNPKWLSGELSINTLDEFNRINKIL